MTKKLLLSLAMALLPFGSVCVSVFAGGGIIETRNGFEAPLGAIVEIVHGQIL